jgi:hypothetical protein
MDVNAKGAFVLQIKGNPRVSFVVNEEKEF